MEAPQFGNRHVAGQMYDPNLGVDLTNMPFYETTFGQEGLVPLAQRAMGQAPSPAAMQQQLAMAQLQRQQLMAAGPRAGGNPALARLGAAQASAPNQLAMLAQGGQARLQEQTMAQRALMNAQFQQRQMQMQEAQAFMEHQRKLKAAQMANEGAMMAGATGAVGTILTGAGSAQSQAGQTPSMGR